jgi:hypothetical protein
VPGPNGISQNVLKELEKEATEPLAIIYRKSLTEGKVPTD